jgi:hypothetical protein
MGAAATSPAVLGAMTRPVRASRPPGARTHTRPRVVSPAPARRPLRLTRRGRAVLRLVVAGLVLTAAVIAVLAWGGRADAGTAPGHVAVRYHVVLPGETLWQIAASVAPDADRRDTIDRILELNAMPGSGVFAGQRIALPVTD